MKKLHTSKSIFENGWCEDAYPHPTPQTISYRNHPKSLACFNHLAPLVLCFFTKRHSQKEGGGGAWHNAPLNTFLSLRLDL